MHLSPISPLPLRVSSRHNVARQRVHVVRSVVINCHTFLASVLLVVANVPFIVLFPKTFSPDNVTVTRQEAIKIVMSQPLCVQCTCTLYVTTNVRLVALACIVHCKRDRQL